MVKYDVQNSDEHTELALITPSNGTKPYYDLENEISVLTHNKVQKTHNKVQKTQTHYQN